MLIGLVAAALAFAFPPTALAWPNLAVAIALLGATVGAICVHVADMVAAGDGPPVDLMLANASSAVEWAHGSVFEPNYAALNGSLQFAGELRSEAGPLAASPEAQARAARAFQARFGAYEAA